MSRSNPWPSIAKALLAAAGIAMVWAIGFGWIGSVIGSIFTPEVTYEYVSVTRDGALLISGHDRTNYRDITYRTLAGKRVTMSDDQAMPQARLIGPYREPGLAEQPIPWTERLVGLPNNSRPLQAWYLLRDAKRPGSAVFEVFDQGTKRRAGYYGSAGWRAAEPPRDEWFDVGSMTITWTAMPLVGQRYFDPGGYVWNNSVATDDTPLHRWKAYVLDGEAVVEVDMRNRTHRTLPGVAGLSDIGNISIPTRPVSFEEAQAAQSAWDAQGSVDPSPLDDKPWWSERIVVRGEKQMRVVDPANDAPWEFELPDALGDSRLDAYVFGEDLAVLNVDRGGWSGGPLREVLWINRAGETLRSERLELAGWVAPSPRQTAWSVLPAAPVPGLAAIGTFIAPLFALQEHRAATYGEGLASIARQVAPPLIAVALLGLLCAALALWRHRRERRDDGVVWAVFVGLLGPAGLVAYLAHFRSQPSTACERCGQPTPRDREACARCGEEWAAPEPLGSEVYDAPGLGVA